jgi:hypothetical protein
LEVWAFDENKKKANIELLFYATLFVLLFLFLSKWTTLLLVLEIGGKLKYKPLFVFIILYFNFPPISKTSKNPFLATKIRKVSLSGFPLRFLLFRFQTVSLVKVKRCF